ncbi:P-II family nitrogen regulator [Aerococcus urinae]|nr:P-II family nitrogen regulator [Aerococcus urinae]MCY3059859.1 P-II family nitrogen regulator [Aerococcus urinae]
MMQEMIITIVDHKYGRDVIKTAREAGAVGATVVKGRGAGYRDYEAAFDVTIEEEKDIVLMVVDSEKVSAISQAIVEKMNLRSPNSGITFSLPVNNTTGLLREIE